MRQHWRWFASGHRQPRESPWIGAGVALEDETCRASRQTGGALYAARGAFPIRALAGWPESTRAQPALIHPPGGAGRTSPAGAWWVRAACGGLSAVGPTGHSRSSPISRRASHRCFQAPPVESPPVRAASVPAPPAPVPALPPSPVRTMESSARPEPAAGRGNSLTECPTPGSGNAGRHRVPNAVLRVVRRAGPLAGRGRHLPVHAGDEQKEHDRGKHVPHFAGLSPGGEEHEGQ